MEGLANFLLLKLLLRRSLLPNTNHTLQSLRKLGVLHNTVDAVSARTVEINGKHNTRVARRAEAVADTALGQRKVSLVAGD